MGNPTLVDTIPRKGGPPAQPGSGIGMDVGTRLLSATLLML
jgi:hypothetical protein